MMNVCFSRFKAWKHLIAIGTLMTAAGCGGGGTVQNNPAGTTKFAQTNLVSDVAGTAAVTDPNLVNPWGVAFAPGGPFWVSDNHSGKSTLYNGLGAIQALVVNIPTPSASTGGSATGQVYNGTADFMLADGQPALFIFATEDGTISAWNASSGSNAELKVNRSSIPTPATGAVYKGLAIGSNAGGNFIFATNFRSGTIEVFGKNFAPAILLGTFTDPNLPAGFGPFGIQNIGGNLFVTYAKQDVLMHDSVAGIGNGVIDVFDTNGNFVRRFGTGSGAGGTQTTLNAPWGLAIAPTSFGGFGSALLVGNFGDGHISAYNVSTGAFLGQMQNSTGSIALAIPGLWALVFGNGGSAGATSTLFFTAGIGDPPNFTTNLEHHGLFGSLLPTP